MIFRLVLLITLATATLPAFAQITENTTRQNSEPSTCGYVVDPEMIQFQKQITEAMYAPSGAKNRFRESIGRYKVPVVVHVIEPSKYSSAIPDEAIREGIENLNKIYRGIGEYENSPDIGIEFELARYDPNCNPTTGITRYDASGSSAYVNDGFDHQSLGEIGNWVIWDRKSYLNIWIVHRFKNNAVAGVANSFTGAIVKNTYFFVGAVAAHEVGHYLGLGHTFPESNSIECKCGDGDGLKDTPDLMTFGIGSTCEHNGQCEPADMEKINPCTGKAFGLVQKNIMNYSCQELFTDDQRTMMRGILETAYGSLLNSPALSTSPPLPEATLAGPPVIYLGRHGVEGAGVKASCPCGGEIIKQTINGKEVALIDVLPIPGLPFGGATTWNHGLTCSDGSTTSKTFRFQRIGVPNLQTICTSENTYSITFDNPADFSISTSAGTIVDNSIVNIPNTKSVTLKVTTQEGYSDSLTIDVPCCANGIIANLKCIPVSKVGTGDSVGIDNFTFGSSISRSSSSSVEDGSHYIDFSCSEQATVNAGESYSVSVKGHAAIKSFIKLYIDYNDDGDFNGGGELVLSGTTSGVVDNLFAGNIKIPTHVVEGRKLRLRILADVSANSGPCSLDAGGQIEDYCIFVSESKPLQNSLLSRADIKAIQQDWAYMEGKGFRDFKFPVDTTGQNFRVKALSEVNQNRESADALNFAHSFVFPNPIRENHFMLTLPDVQSREIRLYSGSGLSIPIDLEKTEIGGQLMVKMNSRPSPGIYYLKITSGGNDSGEIIRMVIL